MANDITTTDACEVIIRSIETAGEMCFEKNYIKNGEIKATVIAAVGPEAEELLGLFREWCVSKGMKQTTERDRLDWEENHG